MIADVLIALLGFALGTLVGWFARMLAAVSDKADKIAEHLDELDPDHRK